MPLAKVIHNFYDIKRRINYIKINKMLHGNSFVEKIKIHDSDTSESYQTNIEGSLLKILPLAPKKSFRLYSKRKEIDKSNADSYTVFKINQFLGNLFQSDHH